MFWMEEHKDRKIEGCEVCSTIVMEEDGEEEMTSLAKKLEDAVILQDTLYQEKSGIIKMKKEPKKKDGKLILPEIIHESSELPENKKCIICFFGKHKNHSYSKQKEAIILCEDCKYRIATFYILHIQKWHELLGPNSKRKISHFEHKKDRSSSCASSHKTGRRRRRTRSKRTREGTGRKSYQQVLQQRYEDGDPTVGPLGQPSGKFDYLVEYYTVESKRNSFNASYESLFSPTGWGNTE